MNANRVVEQTDEHFQILLDRGTRKHMREIHCAELQQLSGQYADLVQLAVNPSKPEEHDAVMARSEMEIHAGNLVVAIINGGYLFFR